MSVELFTYFPSLYEECKAFFFFHPHLQKIILWQSALTRIKFSEYAKVIRDLPNLVDVKIENIGSVEEIKGFIENHRNLFKLELSTDSVRFGKAEMNLIRSEFENEWDIEESFVRDYKILHFERKNSTVLLGTVLE